MEAHARLRGDRDLSGALGIEIGALHAPLLPATLARIVYVDYADTATLRANFRHPGVSPDAVVEVDIVWGERPLREAVGAPADIIIASHVIEHVPDPIGWLAELHAALRLGGTLGLAIPDRRATFDAWRADTSIGEWLEAYLEHRTRPSLRQVFDNLTHSAIPGTAWRPGDDHATPPAVVLDRLADAYRYVQTLAAAPSYIDCHCSVFTPSSFLGLLDALLRMGLLGYVVEAFHPTEPGAIEFQCRLRAADPTDPAIPASLHAARATLAPT